MVILSVSSFKGYVQVEAYRYGYQQIECQGSENTLSECEIGDVSTNECNYVAVVTDCFNGNNCIYYLIKKRKMKGLKHVFTFLIASVNKRQVLRYIR